MLVVGGPDKTLEPPVRTMEPVGVVMTRDYHAGRGKTLRQHRTAVDANVSTGHVVILVRERPVDELRTETRHGNSHRAAGSKDARQFAHSGEIVGDVFENLRADHAIEGAVGEG